jgi:hypothetical protein
MINKILADCVGQKLYSGVDSKMGSNTIEIVYNSAFGSRGEFRGNKIVIGSYESNILYHELFHLYQYYAGGFSNFTSRELNYEVEAWYVQYLYLSKQPEFSGSKWEKRYENKVGDAIRNLKDEIETNGMATTELNARINGVATALRNIRDTNGTFPYKNASYDSGYSTLQNFSSLSSGCP